MSGKSRLFICLLLATVVALGVGACRPTTDDDIPERAREHFERASRAYNDGDYAGAISGYTAIVEIYSYTRLYPLSRYRLAYAEYQLKNYDQAASHFARFISEFPDHELLEDARLLYARAQSERGRYYEAAESLGFLANDPEGRFYGVALDSFLDHFAILDRAGKQRLIDTFATGYLGAYLFHMLGREAYERGDLETAALYLRRLENHPLSTTYRTQGRELLARVIAALEGRPKVIGVLVPLTGDWSIYGREIRTAVELAAARYNAGHERKVELVFVDCRGTTQGAEQGLQSLAEDSQAIAVIGPISSTAFAAVIPLAEFYELPILSPAATEDGLAARSSFAFRNALTYENQTETLARFCKERLGLTRFGILYEDTPYGEGMRRAFHEAAQRHGLSIIVEQSYPLEARSYVDECRVFRQKGLHGIFIPGHQPQITELASQLVFYGIVAELIGGNGWNSESVPRMGMRYVEGAIFTDAIYLRSRDSHVQSFIAGYRSRLGSDPTYLGAHAYDSFGMLAWCVNSGALTRPDLRDKLSNLRSYPGIIGLTTIDADGEAHKPLVVLTIVENEIVEFGTAFGR